MGGLVDEVSQLRFLLDALAAVGVIVRFLHGVKLRRHLFFLFRTQLLAAQRQHYRLWSKARFRFRVTETET